MGCSDDMREINNQRYNIINVSYNNNSYNQNNRVGQSRQYLNTNNNYIYQHQPNNFYNYNINQYQQNYNNQNISNINEQINKNNETNNRETPTQNNYSNYLSTEENIIKPKEDNKIEKIEVNKLDKVINSKENDYNPLKDDDYEIKRKKLLNIIESNKANLKSIASSFPERNSINLEDMALHMKQKTEDLSEIEKAYLLFYWFHLNIEYDVEGYFSGDKISKPESVYKYGKGVCAGYSRLYKYFGEKMGFNVGSIIGYAKGYGWKDNTVPESTNHEWNYIYIEGVYYLLDVTWGSGFLRNNKYERSFDERKFLPSPRIFLFSHLPEDKKFQLVENPITLEEFSFSIKVPKELFELGFYRTNIIRSDCIVKNREKFIIYYDITNKSIFDINIYLFNKKGKYELEIVIFNEKIKYLPTCLDDAREKFEFTQEEKDNAFVANLNFILDLEYTNINKENPIINNRENFIFKPMLKIKELQLNKIEEFPNAIDEWSRIQKKPLYRSLMINNDKIENKTEIIGIFNLKGKYEMKITFENNYVFKYNMICEEDSKDKLELKPEDLNRYEFNESLENENFAFVSHKTNSFNVKNKETFIFQGTHKYYGLAVSLIKDEDIFGFENNKFIRVKPREDETKFEVEIFFNKKGKYKVFFYLHDLDPKNVINLYYYLYCEEDSRQINEFPREEYQRLNFYRMFPFFKYLSQKSNTFIAKNREIFVLETTKKIEFDSLPSLKLINDENYFESIVIKNSVNIKKFSDYKYEIEVALNKKGKYELDIVFHYFRDGFNNTGSLDYYPIIEQDSNPEYIIPIEIIKLTNFNICMKNLDLPENYLSHKNHIFKSDNKEKFIFKLKDIELLDIKLYNPNNEEINTYIWTKKGESPLVTYEIDVSFDSKGRYNIVFSLSSFNLEYFPIVENDIKTDLPLSQNDFGLIPLNHKDFSFDLKDTNTLCLHFKRDEKQKYIITIPESNGQSPKIMTTEIPNEIFYTIGFKEKGKYKIKILCEDSGIFRNLIYNITCEKDSEYDYIKYIEYCKSDEFKLIEPVFNCIKIGKEVKIKIASTLPEIYLDNNCGEEPMDKISDNIFEKTVSVKKENIIIAKKEENIYTYLWEFNSKKPYFGSTTTTVRKTIDLGIKIN